MIPGPGSLQASRPSPDSGDDGGAAHETVGEPAGAVRGERPGQPQRPIAVAIGLEQQHATENQHDGDAEADAPDADQQQGELAGGGDAQQGERGLEDVAGSLRGGRA